MAPLGSVLSAGDTAFAIDGWPTIVMPGSVPAWRTIDADTTQGADVTQLEAFLAGAGFDAGGTLTVDGSVDDATIAAISAWQESLGLAATGRVELGEVVFLAGDVTVVAHGAELGAVLAPGDAVIDIRTGNPFVEVTSDASWVKVGDAVKVDVGRANVDGMVASFSSGIARIDLPADTVVSDGASASVTLQRVKVADRLLVPASSVLRSDVAGPTVRVRTGDTVRTVRVEVIASANDTAAVNPIDGDLKPGDQVARY